MAVASLIPLDGQLTPWSIREAQIKYTDLYLLIPWLQNGDQLSSDEIAPYSESLKIYWAQWDSLQLKRTQFQIKRPLLWEKSRTT